MPREKITRRQKDVSRLLREKTKMRKDKLRISRNKEKKCYLGIGLIALSALTFIISCDAETHYEGKFGFKFPFWKKYDYDNIRVARVIDGDTIELENRERVRLIGIDTPETQYNPKLERDARRTGRDYNTITEMGRQATEFTKDLAEGKNVKLEFDVEKKDKYGRLLAYVYLPDGRMLNAEIVKEGYGQIYTFPPNVKYVDLFTSLQREARKNKRGFWGK